MIVGDFSIKKDAKTLTTKIVVATLLATLGLALVSTPANAGTYLVPKDGTCWEWSINQGENAISDLSIRVDCIQNERLLSDLYDGYGRGSVNNSAFNWNLTEPLIAELIAGRPIIIPGEIGEATVGSSYTITFSENNVTYEINSTEQTDNLRIQGNGSLGSDSGTKFVNVGGYFFSYEAADLRNGNFMPGYDPIIMWETNGVIDFTDGNDRPTVTKTGNMLQVKHYVYAYRSTDFSNSDAFFDLFSKFVNEDKTRTDIFTAGYTPAKKATPALRQTYNLSFDQSQHGSDTLSDPDGQLRKTIDSINAKYGNLLR